MLADSVDDGGGGSGGEIGGAVGGSEDVNLGCESGVWGGQEELAADFHGCHDEDQIHQVFWSNIRDFLERLSIRIKVALEPPCCVIDGIHKFIVGDLPKSL